MFSKTHYFSEVYFSAFQTGQVMKKNTHSNKFLMHISTPPKAIGTAVKFKKISTIKYVFQFSVYFALSHHF